MKKKLLIIAGALSLCITGAIFAGCNGQGGQTPPAPPAGSAGIEDGTGDGYSEQQYSYSFQSNGGSDVAGGTLYKNEMMSKPQSPVRSGYKFTGWYFDEECTRLAEFVNYRMPGHNITFYAGWEKLISITFDTNGGKDMAAVEGSAGEEVGEVATPEYEGYVFEGWYADEDCTQRYNFGVFPDEDVTVYAKWRARNMSVKVTFVDENGESETKTYAEGDEIELEVKQPAGDGAEYLEYAGWAVSSQNGRVVSGKYTVTNEDTTLTLTFKTHKQWAKITVNPSMYLKEEYREQGFTFYAQKGYPLSDHKHNLEGYSGDFYNTYFDDSIVAGQRIEYIGLTSTHGVAFDPDKDLVAGDMELVPDFSSIDLQFDGVYTLADYPSGALFYGEADIRTYLGIDADKEISSAQWAQFQKVYYMVTGYTCQQGITEIYIPDNYKGDGDVSNYPVVLIMDGAFKGLTEITKVRLPLSLMSIQKSVFEGCTNLSEITLPEGLSEISDSAFKDCASLLNVNIPKSLLIFGYNVFYNTPFESGLELSALGQDFIYLNNGQVLYKCMKEFPALPQDFEYDLTNPEMGKHVLTLSDGDIYSIAGGAFAGRKGLVGVAIGKGVELIGNGAFKGCTDLHTFIPSSDTLYILDEAFMDCTSLVEFLNKDTLMQLGARAFKNCTSLVGIQYQPPADGNEEAANAIKYDRFYIGLNLMTIGESVFENCTSLTHVEMARYSYLDGPTLYYEATILNYIPQNAFKGCTNLVEFRAMDDVLEIASGAFEGCTSLKTVYLGDTADSYISAVRKDAFKGCTGLRRVVISRPVTTDNDDLVKFEDGCFDETNEYFYIQVMSTSSLTSYSASTEMYKDHFTTTNTGAPAITVKSREVAIEGSAAFTIDAAYLKKYASAEDTNIGNFKLTPEGDLVWAVASVELDGKTVKPNADGTFDLSEEGTYTVTFTVSDAYGVSSNDHIYLVVNK